MDFPGGSEVKVSAWNAGDQDLIPGSGRSPGEGNGNPFQYSCLENPMEGGAWSAIVHGVAKSRTRLSDFTFTFFHCFKYKWLKWLKLRGCTISYKNKISGNIKNSVNPDDILFISTKKII